MEKVKCLNDPLYRCKQINSKKIERCKYPNYDKSNVCKRAIRYGVKNVLQQKQFGQCTKNSWCHIGGECSNNGRENAR